jgi:precorrin-8X/cobalt-precorrin-8 methylmutase
MGVIAFQPQQIEVQSLRIIDQLVGDLALPRYQEEIVKRVIHATADTDYAQNMLIHPQAVSSGLGLIRAGKNIITDVNMLKAGIDDGLLKRFGGKVRCLVGSKRVIDMAGCWGITRSAAAIRLLGKDLNGCLAAIGNAPTALQELCRLVEEEGIRPGLIVGVPVGFVGAVEAKARLMDLPLPYITNIGRKGGSAVAAAAVNALLKLAINPNNSGIN